eukprot:Selendium_serpulae@DN5757_c0_g1_i1.p3
MAMVGDGAAAAVGDVELADVAVDGVTLMSLDNLPRVTTAQKMDILSSTAKLAGYRAVVEALGWVPRMAAGEITAAGKFAPLKALVIGCGVAGLQAVGDLKRVGADVRAFDTRTACAEQVKSLGGKFLVLDFSGEETEGGGGYAKPMSDEFIAKEMELFLQQAEE